MLSKRSREGYLMVDHRASPGLPSGFMRNLGLDCPEAPEGKLVEAATLICCHCGNIYVKNPERTRARGHCFKCNDFECDGCAATKECTPFSKTLDMLERRAYQADQNNLALRSTLKT